MKCKYRVVLAIDGGGIRGVIPLRLLEHLNTAISEIEEKTVVTNWVDVFCSTSTSTIFTGALMLKNEQGEAKHSPKDILKLYTKRGKQIFSRNIGLDAANSKYPLRFVLDYFFGKTSMRDLEKHFLFVSYDQNAETTFTFSNALQRYQDLPLSDVMSACSAYPGVFPPYKLGTKELIDGMLATQNPSILALEYARMVYPNDPIVVISLGTGIHPEKERDMFELESEQTHEKMLEISQKDRNTIYFRFQPQIEKKIEYVFENENQSILDLVHYTELFIEHNHSEFKRLLHLMEIRTKG